jgi:hypothetical protein
VPRHVPTTEQKNCGGRCQSFVRPPGAAGVGKQARARGRIDESNRVGAISASGVSTARVSEMRLLCGIARRLPPESCFAVSLYLPEYDVQSSALRSNDRMEEKNAGKRRGSTPSGEG